MIKDVKPNKYMLEAVKSRGLLFKFWDPLHNFRTEEMNEWMNDVFINVW